MASPQAIAEGRITVSADQINYQQKMFSHPSYRLDPQYPNTFGQSIALNTSQNPVVIQCPPEVINLSQSYLNYTVTLPAQGANNYAWYALNALQEIAHVQFYSANNQWIADIDQLPNYLDIVLKKELARDEWESDDTNIYSLSGFGTSNAVVDAIPALRNGNYTNANVDNGAAVNSSVNYVEPAYWTLSAANQPVSYNVQFPLKYIKNSVFSIDKDLYFGGTTYLKLYFGPITKFAFQSSSNASPNGGGHLALTGNPTITNLQLMLAIENNQDIRSDIMGRVQSEGLSYLIPYVQSFKNSNTGQAQTVSIQLDQGFGRSLLKVYHAPYNNFEQFNAAFDHCNTIIDNTHNNKVNQYYTQLNGKRVQDITIDCTENGGFLDYMSHKRQLRGSIISNLNIYQFNFFHCDDFSCFDARYDQDNKGELISGIPMTVAPLTWSFVGVSMANNLTFQHYTWFVFIKKLSMLPGQVIVQ